MNHVNYFAPFESRLPTHEDQLTRAFLVVLRLVPMAQAAFLDLVRDKIPQDSERMIPPLSALQKTCEFGTQVGKINQSTGTLISVLITDEHWVASKDVAVSDRGARYDGVMYLGPEWIVSIENKPRSYNVWEGQLSPNLPIGSEVEVAKTPVVLTWDVIISRLDAVRRQGLLSWAEGQLVDDFLEFVSENFAFLNPYKSFGACRGDHYLTTKRCWSVLREIAPGAVKYHRDNAEYVEIPSAGAARKIFLNPEQAEPGRMVLAIYPGDTVAQSQAFFEAADRDTFLGLQGKGWTIQGNLHFSFMATNLVWPATALSVADYFDFWDRNRTKIRQVRRDEFEN